MHRQLLLDLGAPPPATFDNFVTGANGELLARLRGLVVELANQGAGAPWSAAERSLYIWGEPGSGRSHLLQALCHALPPGTARVAGPRSPLHAFGFDAGVALYAIDDCDALSAAAQIAVFSLFNEVRAHPHALFVATGNAAPRGLAVRDDLRTRLGWGLVYRLATLSDADKIVALTRAARARGLQLGADVPAYLLSHFQRDMPHLMALFDALDRFALERHRAAVTVPLLRAMLAAMAADNAAPGAAASVAERRQNTPPALDPDSTSRFK